MVKRENIIFKWITGFNGHLFKDEHIKRYSKLLVTGEMQIKTTRYHFTTTWVTITNIR
jgi:hypothetical protein